MLKNVTGPLIINVNDVFVTPQPHKFTALHMAIEQGHKGIIQLLLSHEDINVNATDEVSFICSDIKVSICNPSCGVNGQYYTVTCDIHLSFFIITPFSSSDKLLHCLFFPSTFSCLPCKVVKKFLLNLITAGKAHK